MPQVDISLLCRSLTWLSEAVACLSMGSIRQRFFEKQIARPRAVPLLAGQSGNRIHGWSAGLVAEANL